MYAINNVTLHPTLIRRVTTISIVLISCTFLELDIFKIIYGTPDPGVFLSNQKILLIVGTLKNKAMVLLKYYILELLLSNMNLH